LVGCYAGESAQTVLSLEADRIQAEIPIILRLSLPVFFTQLAEWSLVLASVISIGHLGTTELAAASYVPFVHSCAKADK
jgi:Na+-driven multidrug efflux pump